jgi:23S rRNA pseudouridine2605 synthase
VNGKMAELGAKADPAKDVIKVDGKRVVFDVEKVYIMLNKPMGVVTTNVDEFDRKTVRDLIPIKRIYIRSGDWTPTAKGWCC